MNARYISSNSCSSLGFLWLYSCRIWDRGPSWKDSGSSQINSKCYWMQIQYILVIAIVLQELHTYNLIWTFRDFFPNQTVTKLHCIQRNWQSHKNLSYTCIWFFLQRLQQVYCEACLVIKITIQVEKNASSLLQTQISLCCSAATELLQLQWRTWGAVV